MGVVYVPGLVTRDSASLVKKGMGTPTPTVLIEHTENIIPIIYE